MEDWMAEFETHTRSDVVKACNILARGIGADTLLDRLVLLRINGGWQNGKTLIVDAMAQIFSDVHDGNNIGEEDFMQENGKAFRTCIGKALTISGQSLPVTFAHAQEAEEVKHSLSSRFDLVRNGLVDIQYRDKGLDMQSFLRGLGILGGDQVVEIYFRGSHEWNRRWEVRIKGESLHTGRMKRSLDQLRTMEEQRIVALEIA